MKDQVNKLVNDVQTLVAFSAKYADKMQDHSVTVLVMDGPGLSFYAPYSEDKKLALQYFVGETFGREGWTKQLTYGSRYFDWTKEVDGVTICLSSIEPLNLPKDQPVRPTEFPLALPTPTPEADEIPF